MGRVITTADKNRLLAERRYGRFALSDQLVGGSPAAAMIATADMVILRAEHYWATGMIVYEAACAEFEPIADSCSPTPEYAVEIHRDCPGPGQFKRVIRRKE